MQMFTYARLLLMAFTGFATSAACAERCLDTVHQLSQVILSEAEGYWRFDLTARVSYMRHQPSETILIGFEDESGAAISNLPLDLLQTSPMPGLGDVVRLAGTTQTDGEKQRTTVVRHLSILSHGPPPRPTATSIQDILDGRCDFRLARFSGVLRDAVISETYHDWTILVVCDKRERIFVSVPNARDSDFDDLVGKRVFVTGIAIPRDKSGRDFWGPTFETSSRDAISPALSHPDIPTAESIPDISEIRYRRMEEMRSLGYHSATGLVIAVWPPRMALLRTPGGTCVGLEFLDDNLPACGDTIRAVGLPESDLFNLNLDHVTCETTSVPRKAFATPLPVSVNDIISTQRPHARINSKFHGKAISLSGTVSSISADRECGRIYLESDGHLVPVDVSSFPRLLGDVSVVCRLAVSGTCVMEKTERRQTSALLQLKGFMIVIRKPDDIQVIGRPSWWTIKRLTAVIGALSLCLLGILGWNIALRNASTRKGRALMREQLEHIKAELKTEERTRLAVELHDSIAQNLTGVSLEIDTAGKLADEDRHAMLAHLGVAAQSLKSCRNELRNCLWDLRNRALETRTMDEAIRQTLAPHIAGVAVAVRFNVPRERISDNTAHAILRIIRELTLNGIRHGGATKVWIAGSIENGRMHFSVRDNGCGFDPGSAPGFDEGHYGLLGIQERIDEFEGEFTLKSSPGKGTRATVSIKVPQET